MLSQAEVIGCYMYNTFICSLKGPQMMDIDFLVLWWSPTNLVFVENLKLINRPSCSFPLITGACSHRCMLNKEAEA